MRQMRSGIWFVFLIVAFAPAARGQGPLFSDVASTSGSAFVHTGLGINDAFIGTGAVWFDFDRDGDLDLYVTRRIGANVLFRNNGDTSFDGSLPLGLADAGHDGAGVAAADYDNDGWLDLYLANSDGDVLFRNIDGTSFQDVTSQAGLSETTNARGTSVAWGDYDADGYLDLYVANHMNMGGVALDHRNRIYHNNGDGTFTRVLSSAPVVDINGFSFIGAWTDYDDDGDLDVFLVNDCAFGGTGTYVFRNDGGASPESWVFTDVSADIGAADCRNGMGIAIGDYDRDGLLDYFYTNIGPPLLLRNTAAGFEDVTQPAGVDEGTVASTGEPRWTWGCNFFDFDLDGWVDLYVSSGGMRRLSNLDPQPNMLYRNDGNGMTFTNVSVVCGADDIDRTRTSVVGDYDNDGDLDLYVVNYEEDTRLFRNENASGNHYLTVDLQGVASNRDGIGSRLRAMTPDGQYRYAEVHSGSSLGGGDEISARFGLGASALVAELVIRWPSGVVMVLEDVAADQRINVVEDVAAPDRQTSGFNAELDGDRAHVSWETRYEQGMASFEPQQKVGASFVAIGQLAAGGTTLRPNRYSFDTAALSPGTYEFRLKQTQTDGSVSYSQTVAVDVPDFTSVVVSQAQPNPFTAQTRITLSIFRNELVRVELYDVRGRLVRVVNDGAVAAGVGKEYVVNGEGLSSGVYWVVVNGASFTEKRKIVLVR